jgi:hypothetical protein
MALTILVLILATWRSAKANEVDVDVDHNLLSVRVSIPWCNVLHTLHPTLQIVLKAGYTGYT